MLRRWSLGLALSVALHVGAACVLVGVALFRDGAPGPVDVDVVGMRVDEVKDLPLGAPAPGARAASPRAHVRAPAVTGADGTLASRDDKAPPRAGADEGDDSDDGGNARVTDVRELGPAGARLTVLLRLDRLKGTAFADPVDQLLMRMPDRRDLLEGTGLSLYDDFDALLVSTPNPLDPTVTFLAARHHVSDGKLRAAIDRGARATGRTIAWRSENGRPWGERRARAGAAPPPGARDERILVLPAPGLVIVTPPAYRKLLLAHGQPPMSVDGGAVARAGTPDGGAAGGGAADGGALSAPSWSALLRRIDAEDGLLPGNGMAMVTAADLLKAGTTSWMGVALDVPREVTAVLGAAPEPFVEVTGTYADEAQAQRLEVAWPGLQRKLRNNPYVLLGGFSAVVGRATLARDGARIVLHVTATPDEARRLLQFVTTALGG